MYVLVLGDAEYGGVILFLAKFEDPLMRHLDNLLNDIVEEEGNVPFK